MSCLGLSPGGGRAETPEMAKCAGYFGQVLENICGYVLILAA